MRHLYGDLFYQMFRRFNRLNDPFQIYVLPTTLTALYLMSHQHVAFMVYFTLMIERLPFHVLRINRKSFQQN